MSITANTEVRHLPTTFRQQLADILDLHDGWRKLASIVTRSATNLEPLYREEHLNVFGTFRKSPTQQLLADWGTRGIHRPTLQTLLNNLIKIEHYRAADFIATVVLKGQAPARPNVGPAAAVSLTEFGGYTTVRNSPVHESDNPLDTSSESQTTHRTREPDQENQNASTNLTAISDEARDGANPSVAIPHISFSNLFKSTLGFSKNQKLGQGGFGAVYLGNLELNGKETKVAVKRLNIGEDEQFRTELKVMTRYIHDNLLPILAFSCDHPQGRCLICTYMVNGSLEDRLAQRSGTPALQWKCRLNIAVGTARGLVALHTMHAEEALVHRDIKSANILLDGNLNAKIGDFGIARLGSDWDTTTKIMTSKWCGTPVYMADEALRGSITVKMDTYSFGVVLLELLTGLPPFDKDRSEPDLLSFVYEDEKEADEWKDPKAGEWPENVAAELFEIATRCTSKKKIRPLMEEILPDLEKLHQE